LQSREARTETCRGVALTLVWTDGVGPFQVPERVRRGHPEFRRVRDERLRVAFAFVLGE
jgi:uncharacterized protein YjeT (DUF2065 family)